MKKLWVASQKVWGRDIPNMLYFETQKERDSYVRTNDYSDKAGTVTITDEQYDEWKRFGEFRQW